MAGCAPNPGPNDDVPSPVDYVYYNGGSPGVYKVPVIKFEYNGHQYIRFGEYQSTCVVHDPDCKCHKVDDTVSESNKNNNNDNKLFDW